MIEKARKRWEKAFEKKMTKEEFVMFRWGYGYAIIDGTKTTFKEGCPNIEHCVDCNSPQERNITVTELQPVDTKTTLKEGCAND